MHLHDLLPQLLDWLQKFPLLCAAPVVVAVKLAACLKRRGWTARSLAVRAGLPEKTVNRILTGKVKKPHLATIEAISEELEASPEEIGMGAVYQYRLQNGKKKQR